VRWLPSRSLSAKLIMLLLAALVGIFGLLGYLNIRLHREHLEAATLASAERVSDLIKRSTSYSMMRNDREGLYQMMSTIAGEPGVVRVRIFDESGNIRYSTDSAEINQSVDKSAEACYGCHAQTQPLARLQRPDRFRIYRAANRERILGIISPIENHPDCSNAACHGHPEGQKILGVLDTNLSLARADTQLAQSSRRMLAYTVMAVLAISLLSWLFVWQVLHRPVRSLRQGTEHLAAGDLGYQIPVGAQDELGELARSFNGMSTQLQSANTQLLEWSRTLEDRVGQKTRELKRAHEHMLHVEKMASMGRMAAVVAHEVNNPLAGILTYSKLLKKWLDRAEIQGKREEAGECLDLIASESRRCGDLVRNLLSFSRTAPINLQPTDLNDVVERALRLVQHQMDMSGIQVQPELADELPRIFADPAQIEQVLLALIMNAHDAMPQGGNLWIQTRLQSASSEIQIEIRDDGCGIPPELLAQIFEPFLSTKEGGHSVGLGLAISLNIIEAHQGRIEVQSEVGRGAKFTVTLPAGPTPAGPATKAQLAEAR
jgi:two-component system NtrC family sensor kinase